MFAGGLILGTTLIAFAIWLHRQEQHGWEGEHRSESELDVAYYRRRRRSRMWVHLTLGGCGVLIYVATFFGPGVVWLICWMLVSIALLAVVAMALIDALRTHRYHNQKLPEIRRRWLGDEE